MRTFYDSSLSMYRSSFYSLKYFKRYAPDKLIISKIKEHNAVITYNRIIVLALCTISNDRFSINEVSFDSRLYF